MARMPVRESGAASGVEGSAGAAVLIGAMGATAAPGLAEAIFTVA